MEKIESIFSFSEEESDLLDFLSLNVPQSNDLNDWENLEDNLREKQIYYAMNYDEKGKDEDLRIHNKINDLATKIMFFFRSNNQLILILLLMCMVQIFHDILQR